MAELNKRGGRGTTPCGVVRYGVVVDGEGVVVGETDCPVAHMSAKFWTLQ